MAKNKEQILDALVEIQSEISCPKESYNQHGNFKYRSAEDIYAALKPLLKKYGLVLTLTDSVEYISNALFVKAEVHINGVQMAQAFARLADEQKGMNQGQLTGATSSYARKYALQGLFLLDDGQDLDSDRATHPDRVKPAAPAQRNQAPRPAPAPAPAQAPRRDPVPQGRDTPVEPLPNPVWWDKVVPLGRTLKGRTLGDIVMDGQVSELINLRAWLQSKYDPKGKWAANDLAFIKQIEAAILHAQTDPVDSAPRAEEEGEGPEDSEGEPF